jgi:transcription initiation factor IIE alpha subunit
MLLMIHPTVVQTMKKYLSDYPCPKCGEYIAIIHTTPEVFDCPWCKEPLKLVDNGIESNREHIERIIDHGHSR